MQAFAAAKRSRALSPYGFVTVLTPNVLKTFLFRFLVLSLLVCSMPVFAQVTAMQGSFTNTDGDSTNNSYNTLNKKQNLSQIIYDNGFDASEIGNYYITGPDPEATNGRQQVRDVSTAMALTGTDYFGFFSFPSFPGFFDPGDLAQQPGWYRAQSLDSLGRLWQRNPDLRGTEGSRIGFSGEHLDITNRMAVEDLLDQLSVAFDHGGLSESVGPLRGYFMFGEDTLSGGGQADAWGVAMDNGTICDPNVIPGPCRQVQIRRANGSSRTHAQRLLDDDPAYHGLQPAKRMTPLFSVSAKDSFVAYTRSQGFTEILKLPVDRSELNHCSGTNNCLQLASHVQLVPLPTDPGLPSVAQQRTLYGASVANYWRLWGEWCYQTWSEFAKEIAETVGKAQLGNPDFKGSVYFQFPGVYGMPGRFDQPVTIKYRKTLNGPLQDETIDFKAWQHFDVILDPSQRGVDMVTLMKSPWLAGLVHETATGTLPPNSAWNNLTDAQLEQQAIVDPLFVYPHIGQGTVARRLVQEQGKVFGAFFRPEYIRGGVMTPADFGRAWDHVMVPLEPAILFTIRDKVFIDDEVPGWPFDCDQDNDGIQEDPECGLLRSTFLNRINTYRNNAAFMLVEVPWHRTIGEGETATFTVKSAGGSGSHLYRWQRSTNGGASWSALPTTDPNLVGVQQATLEVHNAEGRDAGLYRCRVTDNGQSLFTHGARLRVMMAEDDLAPGSGGINGRLLPVGNGSWIANGQAVIQAGGIEPTGTSARGSVALDPIRADSDEALAVSARVRVPSFGKWAAIAFTELPNPGMGNAELWMYLHRTGRIIAKENGNSRVLLNLDLGLAPGTYHDLELQHRRVNGQTQARVLVDGAEVMAWADINYPGVIRYAGFQIQRKDNELSFARLDDFAVYGDGPAALGQASQPSPAHLATNVGLNANLSWTTGSGAASHDIYFGTDSTPDSTEFQSNQTSTTFDPGTLLAGTTYYWRVNERNASNTTTGPVWRFTTQVGAPGQASAPNPAHLATGVATGATLSWNAGSGATSHDVYFGTDSTPDSTEFLGNQAGTTFNPGALTFSTTYYWRIDERNTGGLTTGPVWRFTTEAAPPPPANVVPVVFDGFTINAQRPSGSVLTGQQVEIGGDRLKWVSLRTRLANNAVTNSSVTGNFGASIPFNLETASDPLNVYMAGLDDLRIKARVRIDRTEVVGPGAQWMGIGFSNGTVSLTGGKGQVWTILRSSGRLDLFYNGTIGLRVVTVPNFVPTVGHDLELRYRVSTQFAEVWLDGVRVIDPVMVPIRPQIKHAAFQVLGNSMAINDQRLDSFEIEADALASGPDPRNADPTRSYYLVKPSSWSAAQAVAESLGQELGRSAYLVSINDQGERNFVYNFSGYGNFNTSSYGINVCGSGGGVACSMCDFEEPGQVDGLWIGYHQPAVNAVEPAGGWQWVGGASSYVSWAPGHPIDNNGCSPARGPVDFGLVPVTPNFVDSGRWWSWVGLPTVNAMGVIEVELQ